MAGADDVRLSLAGAQDKIAVRIVGDEISIPLGGAPSTHILKPAIERFQSVVFNESFCMTLAQRIGLPVAHVETGKVEDIDYLAVKRYDRNFTDAGTLERLHQEDFCQALGIASEQKYQNEGGPSLQQSFELVRETSALPVIDLTTLLDGVLFNFLIGNNDAHGKNFSLLRTIVSGKATIRLAPFYDLLSTAFYPELSTKMAMKFGGEYDSEKVVAKHFDRFAQDANLGKAMVKRRVKEEVEAVISTLATMPVDRQVADDIASLIRRRCEKTLVRLGD
jgi:serine/threonine-protein kinase HipA